MGKPGRALGAVLVLAALAFGCAREATRPPSPTTPTPAAEAGVEARTPADEAGDEAPTPAVEVGHPAPSSPKTAFPEGTQVATVTRIVDGDTIRVAAISDGNLPVGRDVPVRLLEVDTPETVHPSQPVGCGGPEASAYVEQALPVGTVVHLEADRENRDRYDRYLRYVWLEDGTLFNEQLARDGWGAALLYMPNDRHIDRITAAADEARAAGRGVWALPCATTAVAPQPPSTDRVARPTPAPAPPSAPPAGRSAPAPALAADGCSTSYPDVCIPPAPPDLDCGGIDERRFAVTAPDPHGFDGDHDGVGCESD